MARPAQILLAASIVWLPGAPTVWADPISVNTTSSAVAPLEIPFQIIVGSSQGDMIPLFGADVPVGHTVRGTLTYDVNAAGTPAGSGRIFHPITGSIALDVGSGLRLPLDRMDVYDTIPHQSPFDTDTVAGFAFTSSFPGFDYIEATLDFQGPPSSRTTDALPRSVDEIASFSMKGSFRLLAFQTGKPAPFDDGTQSFVGRLRLADATAVTPEPATLLLVAPFAIGLARRGRRLRGGKGSAL